jgi:cation diffusion facilitator family transporter
MPIWSGPGVCRGGSRDSKFQPPKALGFAIAEGAGDPVEERGTPGVTVSNTRRELRQIMATLQSGLFVSKLAIAVNLVLAIVKIATGVIGHSYALVADGIESTADIFSSVIVWWALRLASKPADTQHPFGHGKAESIAGVIVAIALLAAAVLIAVQSVQEIRQPHHAPAWFTLVVLAAVVVLKETLHRRVLKVGRSLKSTALTGDAFHHRSDALTSAAAFVGISIALIGGPGFESADDWAALAACGVIAGNGFRIFRTALDEVMDASVAPEIVAQIRALAGEVEGVQQIEKCRARKSGPHLTLDIHVVVDGKMSVRESHRIAHLVKDRLMESAHRINDVTVHIEPDEL